MSKTYTYLDMATDLMKLLNGEVELSELNADVIMEKLEAFAIQQRRKAKYAATNAKKRKPKGASDETLAKCEKIRKVLSSEFKTASEIAAACGEKWSALVIANCVKFIDGVENGKVVRTTVSAKGLRADKEYTAYRLA